jgi:hypothetical protein
VSDNDWMLWNHPPHVHAVEPVPGEQLFAMTRGSERLTCRVFYHDQFGVEAQFQLDGTLWIGQRFPAKELAIRWAELERHEHRRNGWIDASDVPEREAN